MFLLSRRAFFCLVIVLLGPVAGAAEGVPEPRGPVLLVVRGAIEHANGDGEARLDRAALQVLDEVTIDTTTIWTTGVQSFSGVRLSDILDLVGAQGAALRATAVNDYSVDIPMDEYVDDAVIAYSQNGAPIERRRKGPLWLVYDFDSDATFQSEVFFSRSIWQLTTIDVLD